MTDTNALADQLEALAAKATPGPWEADTIDNEGEYGSGPDTHSGFKSPVMLDPSGKALFDAINGDLVEVHEEYDEDSCNAWDEPGRCNFALIAALRNNLPAIIAALRAEQALAERDALLDEAAQIIGQIELDHRYPPAPDSMDRRIERARDWLASPLIRGDYRNASDADNKGEEQ